LHSSVNYKNVYRNQCDRRTAILPHVECAAKFQGIRIAGTLLPRQNTMNRSYLTKLSRWMWCPSDGWRPSSSPTRQSFYPPIAYTGTAPAAAVGGVDARSKKIVKIDSEDPNPEVGGCRQGQRSRSPASRANGHSVTGDNLRNRPREAAPRGFQPVEPRPAETSPPKVKPAAQRPSRRRETAPRDPSRRRETRGSPRPTPYIRSTKLRSRTVRMPARRRTCKPMHHGRNGGMRPSVARGVPSIESRG